MVYDISCARHSDPSFSLFIISSPDHSLRTMLQNLVGSGHLSLHRILWPRTSPVACWKFLRIQDTPKCLKVFIFFNRLFFSTNVTRCLLVLVSLYRGCRWIQPPTLSWTSWPMLSKTLCSISIIQLLLTFYLKQVDPCCLKHSLVIWLCNCFWLFFLSYFSLYLFLLPWITSQIKSDDPHYFSGRTIYLGRHSKPNAIFPSI